MGKRLIQQRRGKGGIYKAPSHNYLDDVMYPKDEFTGIITEIRHDPGRSGILAMVKGEGGKHWMLACERVRVGQEILVTDEAPVAVGNVLPVGRIPEGIPICNLEMHKGDGGKIVKAAGSSAIVVSHNKKSSTVQLPSGRFKELKNDCRATIGVVAAGGKKDKPFLKAGKKFYGAKARGRKYPTVRGVAMNPVAHPHGGGNHQRIGKPSTVSRNAPPGRKVGHLSPQKRNASKKKGRK